MDFDSSSSIPIKTDPQTEISPDKNSNQKMGRAKMIQQQMKEILKTNKISDILPPSFVPDNPRKSSNTSLNSPMSSIHYARSLEHPPIIDFYRQSIIMKKRPTMSNLIHGNLQDDETIDEFEERNTKIIQSQLKNKKNDSTKIFTIEENEKKIGKTPKKYGWIEGVLIRCIGNIIGVMLFLRMSWIAGQAGLIMSTIIVLLASLVTTITALSMSAICSNGIVKGGGAYYLISRSLGPQFGGSIGIIFCIANIVGAAMYVVGFAEVTRDVLKDHGFSLIDGDVNDVRFIGLAVTLILLAIVFIGLGFEAKMQVILLGIVGITILNFIIGSFFPSTHEKQLHGIIGYSWKTLTENLFPSFRDDYNFIKVFAIYFPAATGIMAGANISGDLKNPTKAIPKGTLLAIGITTLLYLSTIWIIGSSVVRDADGIQLPTIMNETTVLENHGWFITSAFARIFGQGTQFYVHPYCYYNNTCEYGLMNDFQIFGSMSFYNPLANIGIFTAILSSALLCFISGPKVLQAICKDKLFPYITYFGEEYGNTGEPRKGYILTFFMVCIIVMIGDLNTIAPIISNFYLCTYVLVNFACFDTTLAKSPGFRPTFKFYNHWISLIGSLLCLCVMFIISWINALITFIFFGLLYFYMDYRKPDVNWGSSSQAHSYLNALNYVQKLEKIDEHVKNYRPQILVLTGNPAIRPSLIDFAYGITKGNSLLLCGDVIPYQLTDAVHKKLSIISEQIKIWLRKKHIKAFYLPGANIDFRQGVQGLYQFGGLGRLKPNILLVGFKHDWNQKGIDGMDEINDYFGIIQDALFSELAVCILRNGNNGFDISGIVEQGDDKFHSGMEQYSTRSSSVKLNFVVKAPKSNLTSTATPIKSDQELDSNKPTFSTMPSVFNETIPENFGIAWQNYMNEQSRIVNKITMFQTRIKNGIIDVWWLYDDGGLSLLIPYLLTQEKSYLENAKLRIFTVTSNSKKVREEERNLATLLTKFRISFAEVKIISDTASTPSEGILTEFENIIFPFVYDDISEVNPDISTSGLISKTELAVQQDKTWKNLRISEQIHKYSSKSDLIVVTLPVPRKGLTNSCLYLAWIDIMSRKLPPTLFIRGNQQSVLTFYS